MPRSETTATTLADESLNQQAHWDLQQDASAEEQQYRAAAYSMLAALLRNAPDNDLLQHVSHFAEVEADGDDMTIAMSMLGLAARTSESQMLAEEYHQLFIGLGRGEIVPYGSWYLTGFLMEKPLGELRDDLVALGFEREENVHEPEDHIAALCEVMSMLIQESGGLQQQRHLFNAHIAPWYDKFFSDLANAKAAVFYRAVARFGGAFLHLEQRYLEMES